MIGQDDNSFIALRKGICEILKPIKESLPNEKKPDKIEKIIEDLGWVLNQKSKYDKYFKDGKYKGHKLIINNYIAVLTALNSGIEPKKKAIVDYARAKNGKQRVKEISEFLETQLGMEN